MTKQQKKKTKNRKTVPIVVAVVLVAALAAGFVIPAITSRNKRQEPKAEVNPLIDGAVDVLDGEETAADPGTASAEDEPDGNAPDTSPEDGDSPDGSEESAPGIDVSGLIGYTGDLPIPKTQDGGSSSQESQTAEPEIPTISFPYAVSGTDLVVKQISPYSGYFIEDGSDEAVSGVAAIVLTNNGDDLDFVGVGISQGERSLAFSASQIPAGATVIIQEQNKAAFAEDPYFSCTATTTPSSGFDPGKGKIVIEKHNDGTFDVANVSEETIPEVKVFFKNYLPEDDVYVGGITYSVTLTDVEPETAVTVTSSHFDAGYSRIVDVKISG